jgi:3-hydroxyisobutyrate dehydrogenase-like beta-hydroxyacid dehydrogenase
MRAAVVGTGRMGAAMARRIAGAGHELTLFNRTASTAQSLADELGATAAATAREAAESAEVVITSLADDRAVAATYRGDNGVLAGLAAGAVACEASTVDPETPRSLEAAARERGGWLIDTPVSGSAKLVETGQLTVLAGGDVDALDRARPLLESFAATIFHLGDVGSGAVMKLVVNSVIHALNAAVSEAFVLAEKAGLDRATTYDVLEASAVGAPFVKYKRPDFVAPESAPVSFTLDLVAKDLDLIAHLADDVSATMPQADATRALVARAIAEAELGDADMAAIAAYLRSR